MIIHSTNHLKRRSIKHVEGLRPVAIPNHKFIAIIPIHFVHIRRFNTPHLLSSDVSSQAGRSKEPSQGRCQHGLRYPSRDRPGSRELLLTSSASESWPDHSRSIRMLVSIIICIVIVSSEFDWSVCCERDRERFTDETVTVL
jgi:hypothetical protein